MQTRFCSNGAVVFIAPRKAYVRSSTAGGWEVATPWSKAPVWCATWADAMQVLDILFRMRAALQDGRR